MTRCLGCMREYQGNLTICPHCGYNNNSRPKEMYHMMPGSILEGRYIVGKSIEQDGFNITYIGWDSQQKRRVTIKEYFPSDLASRNMGSQRLTIYKGEAFEQFGLGLKIFIDEAQRLSKFNGIKGIVNIYDILISNNTGYIIMEYITGMSLQDMLDANNTIGYSVAKDITIDVLLVLKEVHNSGIIHKNISPKNIFVSDKGEIKLLNFGAERHIATANFKSVGNSSRSGYAPYEQYGSYKEGPWTDVYSLAATFYKLITGVTPLDSTKRISKDDLKAPSKLGVIIPANDENVLLNSLNVIPKNRIKSAEEFLDGLKGKKMARKKEKNLKEDTGKMYKFVMPFIASSVGIIVIFFILMFTGVINLGYIASDISKPFELPEGYMLVKNEVNVSSDIASQQFDNDDVKYVISDSVYSDTIAENCVAGQFPMGGTAMPSDSKVNLVVSLGPNKIEIGLVNNLPADEVINNLKSLGFYNIQQFKGEKNDIVEGTIEKMEIVADLSAEGAEFEEVKEGEVYPFYSAIKVYVSDGSNFKEEEKEVTVPNVVGDDINDARDSLVELGLVPEISYSKSNSYDKNEVISQNPSGSKVKVGSKVKLVVNSQSPDPTVPNVVNQNESSARNNLTNSGFKVSVSKEYNNNFKAGIVISQSAKAGSKLSRGSTVTIIVSNGPEPTTQKIEPTTHTTTSVTTTQTTTKKVEANTEATTRLIITQTTTKVEPLVIENKIMNFNVKGAMQNINANLNIDSAVSNNPSVVEIVGKNQVKAVGHGTATVTVKSGSQSDTITITVNIIKITDVTPSINMHVGETKKIIYNVSPKEYQDKIQLNVISKNNAVTVNGKEITAVSPIKDNLEVKFIYNGEHIDTQTVNVNVTQPNDFEYN